MSRWVVPTLQDYLDSQVSTEPESEPIYDDMGLLLNPEDFPDPEPPILPMRKHKYECPSCNVYVTARRLTDFRGVPGVSTDWACDGCWTHWKRFGISIDGGPKATDEAEWSERFVAAHKAPPETLAHAKAARRNPIKTSPNS